MVGPIAPSSSKTIQIRFKCGIENQTYKSAHNAVLQVPAHLGRKSLKTLLHTLLNLSEEDRPDFHFLVDEVPLRTTLDKFIERRNLSFENTLSLTYFLPIAEPNREPDTSISQNWISSLHAHKDGRVLAGLFSGRSSIVHDDKVILAESSFPHSHEAPVKAVQWLNDNHFLTASSDETACVLAI
ncbi:Ribosome biogenesis protein WDR12-like [Gracilariopsis chorda]|uniref:Ribosome biogenesis protein WDR12-like n=1 Tax=Gracilariopsis chorda TaxID=448386 RepID=A0A2V3IM57_9FLOR|nr:Ribosome biogenesis protein WDR12-like [Gracilariopsis chorda]|eukprot:PXF43158.1 Ribosome biogenesis protein WDR12-like [Gracilariopsis chorda]